MALRHRSVEVAEYHLRFWDHPDWEEIWRLYALAIERMNTKTDRGYDRSLLACSRMRASFFDTAL
jgi:hypothetical protein